ncbi:MAG: hypothetical protein AB1457_16550 [Chloroflexota bacterium]
MQPLLNHNTSTINPIPIRVTINLRSIFSSYPGGVESGIEQISKRDFSDLKTLVQRGLFHPHPLDHFGIMKVKVFNGSTRSVKHGYAG